MYDLALGDEVETEPQGERKWVLRRVAQPSGRFTFRAWFGDTSEEDARQQVLLHLRERGHLFEWHSQNLLAIDAADRFTAQELADFLQDREQRNHLSFETGATA